MENNTSTLERILEVLIECGDILDHMESTLDRGVE